MKIIIRDDDLCYYSDFNVFKHIYNHFDVPVSISLIPFGVSDHGDTHPFGISNGPSKSIEKNIELCRELKLGIEKRHYEVMIHGFTHEYLKKEGKFVPELMWRSDDEYDNLFKKTFELFKRVFGVVPNIFTAPSDKSNNNLFKFLKKYKLNYCGLIDKISSRPFSFRTIVNYINRQFARIKFGYPFCGIMKYKGWNEIQTFQNLDYNYLISVYNVYKKIGSPMVIETHYWQLANKNSSFDNLNKFIEFAKNDGATFCLMSDIFNE